MADVLGKILYTEEDIRKRAKELGAQITEDYAGEELIVLGTLRGAVMWMCDLLKCINLDTKIDFISASSYGSATQTSGVVRITRDVDMDLYKKNVLIVEDIVDTGTTLKYLKNYLTEEEMIRFQGIFANGEYEDMWDKLFLMYDYFEELSIYVAEKLHFALDLEESKNVREFMEARMHSERAVNK